MTKMNQMTRRRKLHREGPDHCLVTVEREDDRKATMTMDKAGEELDKSGAGEAAMTASLEEAATRVTNPGVEEEDTTAGEVVNGLAPIRVLDEVDSQGGQVSLRLQDKGMLTTGGCIEARRDLDQILQICAQTVVGQNMHGAKTVMRPDLCAISVVSWGIRPWPIDWVCRAQDKIDGIENSDSLKIQIQKLAEKITV